MRATRLGLFIRQNIDAILSEWELFAKTRIPAAATMSILELSVWRQLLLPVTTSRIAALYTAADSAAMRVFVFAPAALAR
jgi:hypothetical protein